MLAKHLRYRCAITPKLISLTKSCRRGMTPRYLLEQAPNRIRTCISAVRQRLNQLVEWGIVYQLTSNL